MTLEEKAEIARKNSSMFIKVKFLSEVLSETYEDSYIKFDNQVETYCRVETDESGYNLDQYFLKLYLKDGTLVYDSHSVWEFPKVYRKGFWEEYIDELYYELEGKKQPKKSIPSRKEASYNSGNYAPIEDQKVFQKRYNGR